MLIRVLPLLVAVLPILAVTLAHWLGVSTGRLPACIPYLDGCTSISSTGRHPPGSFVFRAVELPLATALVFVWYFTAGWLRALNVDTSEYTGRWIVAWGGTAAFALVVYTTVLGTSEPLYEFMRRFGIYLYFLGTAVAELLTSLALGRYAGYRSLSGLHRLARWMLAFVALPFALGFLNLYLKSVLDDADQAENRIEWIATLSMQAWFVLLYLAWRKTGFRVAVDAGRGR